MYASATSDCLVSHLFIPLVSLSLLTLWDITQAYWRVPEAPIPTPSPLTQWPVGSVDQLESKFFSHPPLSPHPTSTTLYNTPPLSQDGGKTGKIRQKGSEASAMVGGSH